MKSALFLILLLLIGFSHKHFVRAQTSNEEEIISAGASTETTIDAQTSEATLNTVGAASLTTDTSTTTTTTTHEDASTWESTVGSETTTQSTAGITTTYELTTTEGATTTTSTSFEGATVTTSGFVTTDGITLTGGQVASEVGSISTSTTTDYNSISTQSTTTTYETTDNSSEYYESTVASTVTTDEEIDESTTTEVIETEAFYTESSSRTSEFEETTVDTAYVTTTTTTTETPPTPSPPTPSPPTPSPPTPSPPTPSPPTPSPPTPSPPTPSPPTPSPPTPSPPTPSPPTPSPPTPSPPTPSPPTPSPIPTPGGTGDPHIHGFLGQKFDFHGENGKVFNILSDSQVQINAKIVDADLSPSYKLKTYFGSFAMKFGNDRVFIACDRALDGESNLGHRIELNGQSISESVKRRFEGDLFTMRMNEGRYRINIDHSVYSFTIQFSSSARSSCHLNIKASFRPTQFLKLIDELPSDIEHQCPHGVLGQTARQTPNMTSKGRNGEGVIEGNYLSYNVYQNNLWSDSFNYNCFNQKYNGADDEFIDCENQLDKDSLQGCGY